MFFYVCRLCLAQFAWFFKGGDQNLNLKALSSAHLITDYIHSDFLTLSSMGTPALTASLVIWGGGHLSPEASVIVNDTEIFSLQALKSISESAETSEGNFLTAAWPSGSHPPHQRPVSLSAQCFCSTSQSSLKAFMRVKAFALRWWGQHLRGQESCLLKHFLISLLYLCVSVLLQIILHSFKLASQGFSWQLLGSAGSGLCAGTQRRVSVFRQMFLATPVLSELRKPPF